MRGYVSTQLKFTAAAACWICRQSFTPVWILIQFAGSRSLLYGFLYNLQAVVHSCMDSYTICRQSFTPVWILIQFAGSRSLLYGFLYNLQAVVHSCMDSYTICRQSFTPVWILIQFAGSRSFLYGFLYNLQAVVHSCMDSYTICRQSFTLLYGFLYNSNFKSYIPLGNVSNDEVSPLSFAYFIFKNCLNKLKRFRFDNVWRSNSFIIKSKNFAYWSPIST